MLIPVLLFIVGLLCLIKGGDWFVDGASALARYDARTSGEGPQNSIDTLLDDHFDDARMERIYPNAKKVAKAG